MPHNHSYPCPNCGYCPCCGRSGGGLPPGRIGDTYISSQLDESLTDTTSGNGTRFDPDTDDEFTIEMSTESSAALGDSEVRFSTSD